MKSVSPVFGIVAIACCTPASHAQSSAPSEGEPGSDGALSRIGRWFTMDWSTGWSTDSTWRLVGSPYTYHFSRDPDHKHVYMLGLVRQRADGFIVGGTAFRNSFGQPSTYVYIGQRFDQLGGIEPLFGELSGGVLYGYKPPYDHKVPLNYHGFSPGLVPSLGWKFTPMVSAQLNFLGNSALMFQFSADFQ
jgi:hypothetical protein